MLQVCGITRRIYTNNSKFQKDYLLFLILHKRNYSGINKAQENWKSYAFNGSYYSLPQTTSRRFASSAIIEQTFLTSLWQSISNSAPVSYAQQGLIELHEFTGLPWWTTIFISTFLLRSLITLPLTIYQHKITRRIEKVALEMPTIVEELKKEAAIAMKKYQWTEQQTRAVYQRSLKKQWNKLIIRDNCHPAKTLIVLWGQVPLWIIQSMALRNLVYVLPDPTSIDAKLIFTELTIGGFGWIQNLTEIDSSYILPVTLGLLNLGIIEIQTILRPTPPSRLQRYATNIFRAFSIIMIPIACTVPSALCFYWVSSSAYGLAQNLLLATPSVKKALGIQTKNEISNPYEQLSKAFKRRFGQTVPVKAPPNKPSADTMSRSKTPQEAIVKDKK